MLSMLGKVLVDNILKYFHIFYEEVGRGILLWACLFICLSVCQAFLVSKVFKEPLELGS